MILCSVGFVMLFFPKQLPEALYRDIEKLKSTAKNGELLNVKEIRDKLKEKKKKSKPTFKSNKFINNCFHIKYNINV